ncbi:MAG: TetR/AcrR family transcriptional regulator [Candidatus Xenobiia bacterium LiM19]
MLIRDAQKAQEKILKAAQQLFAERGFWGTSVQDIADRAQVNKAMLFYYFKSKENLYFTLLERILEGVIATTKKHIETHTAPGEKLKALFDLYGELATKPQHFDLFKILFQDIMGPCDRVKDSIKSHIGQINSLVEDVIAQGISTGEFRDADPHLTALSIMGIMYVFARHRIMIGDTFAGKDVSLFMYQIIMDGIRR